MRGLSVDDVKKIAVRLSNNEILEKTFKDHALIGNYVCCRELHLRPNWLLIYQFIGNDRIDFLRTGTHADLF